MKVWKKEMREELICFVIKFLIQSSFILPVNILLRPGMMLQSHLDKKPTGAFNYLLTHFLYLPLGAGRSWPCSYLVSPGSAFYLRYCISGGKSLLMCLVLWFSSNSIVDTPNPEFSSCTLCLVTFQFKALRNVTFKGSMIQFL